MRHAKVIVLGALLMVGLAGCATPQNMTVETPVIAAPNPKYRNAMAVGTINGGQVMNVLTVPGVANEPFKAALEGSLAASGYLAKDGKPKFVIDAQIHELKQPFIGFEYDVTAQITYKVTGGGKTEPYLITANGHATFADSPMGADRIRVANERAMKANIQKFLQALK